MSGDQASLIAALSRDRQFTYDVCSNGHVQQTAQPGPPMYPCATCGRTMERATRWRTPGRA